MLLFFALGCEQHSTALHLYTWADYFKPELLKKFEEQNHCSVVIDTFDSNETMYAKLKAGAGGYDLITPSSYMTKIMYEQGMLQKLDHSKLEVIANIDSDYLKAAIDPEMDHSLPYTLTFSGLGYLKNEIPDFKPSWQMLGKESLKGRMSMLNDMRESLGAALKALGYSLNTVDPSQIDSAKRLLLRWKPNLAKFENEQYKVELAAKNLKLAHGYSGDIMKMREENDEIDFAIPEEGFSLAVDDLVISSKAPNSELAYKFINFIHEPKNAAENSEAIQYLMPNQASYQFLSAAFKANPVLFPAPQVRAKGEVIRDLGQKNQLYIQAWDEVKR